MPRSVNRMRSSKRESAAERAATERIKSWTKERFQLPQDAAVLVSELACGLPGCPPLETVVAFWTEETKTEVTKRHQFKVFKPLDAVTLDDFPPAWMKGPLAVDDDTGFECC